MNYDENGFYVEPDLGNRFHMYHHTPLYRSSRLKNRSDIHEDEEELINDMAEGNAQDSQIQNIVFNKIEKRIPRSIIHQITRVHKRVILNTGFKFSRVYDEVLQVA